ncbi:unnamed protein product [Prunus armeniaca]
MAADRGVQGLKLEEGCLVVRLALVLPESEVGAERKQLPKSARPLCRNPEKSGFIKSELRNIYGYATELLLIVTPSLQFRFESTTSLRTRFVALYATYERGLNFLIGCLTSRAAEFPNMTESVLDLPNEHAGTARFLGYVFHNFASVNSVFSIKAFRFETDTGIFLPEVNV